MNYIDKKLFSRELQSGELVVYFIHMSKRLPLFPLKLVIFPGEYVNLHVFEPRYKELITDCEAQNLNFGIPPFFEESIYPLGTEVKLLEIAHVYEDGKMDIRTQGVGIFKIESFYRNEPDKRYPAADVIDVAFSTDADYLLNEQILECIEELHEALGIKRAIPTDPGQFITFDVAHLVGFTTEQELRFLTVKEEQERQKKMLQHLKKLLPLALQIQEIKRKAMLNGHFRDLMPPMF